MDTEHDDAIRQLFLQISGCETAGIVVQVRMMTLRQLINHVMNRGAVSHVTSCVYNTYYDAQVDYTVVMHRYTCVIRELLELNADDTYSDHVIVLTETSDDTQSHIDVHLGAQDKTYAIDYVDWAQLIDLQVRDDTGLQAHDVLAHILWEITFHGFTNDKVKKSRETLENLCGSLSAE